MEHAAAPGLPGPAWPVLTLRPWRDAMRPARRPAVRPAAAVGGGSHADTLPELEFHAEAGAPEGALYVDGVLFGSAGAR